MAIVSALIKASIDPVEISLTPGCKIKSIPKKPSVNAIIRRIRIVSPSTRAAAKVAKSGAVKLSAVASARGIIVIAVKPAAIPETLINALTPYNFFLLLRKMVKPFFAMNGIKNTSANAFRKKTISNVCSVSEDSRIKIPIVAKNVMAIVI